MRKRAWIVDPGDRAPLIGGSAAQRILHEAQRLRGLRVPCSTFCGGGAGANASTGAVRD